MLQANDAAPDFEVQDHHGRITRLRDFRGKSVLLWFYPAADTPGCTKEGCGFRDEYALLAAKGVEVLGVSVDSVERNAKFAEKYGFPFRLLCDTERKICVGYGACEAADAKSAKRISYLIGPDGRIKHAWPTVKAAEHPAQVLELVSQGSG